MDNEQQELTSIEHVEETISQDTSKKSPKKLLVLGLVVAGILVLAGLGAGTAYGVYRASENPVVVALATTFRVPIAKVNGQPILYHDYIRDLNSLRTYYGVNQPQTPFTPQQQSDQVLSRLIAGTLVEQKAKELNVKVGDDDRDKAKKDILGRFSDDEKKLSEDLKKNLGISLSDFYANVMEPTLLEKKTGEAFSANTDPKYSAYTQDQVKASHILFAVNSPAEDTKIKTKAEKVLAQIKKGADFGAMAKQYGSDGTKDNGGDLGWFGKGEMVPEFETAAFSLKKGELNSKLVKSEFGYHIVKVEDKRTARNFSGFMNDQLKNSTVEILGNVHNPFEGLTKK